MADEFVIRIVPEGMDSISAGAKGGEGGLASIPGMGKIGMLVGMAGIALSIIKPIIPMIKGIGKILGEFLRPIADVIMMLLAPILSLLRPILITFKALMAPFKQAAMTAIAASQKLIGQGMGLGMETEEGKGLIEEGFKGSLQAASLMFSGFIETMFTPLAELFGLGDKFAGAMDAWQGKALIGVHRVIMLSDTIDAFGEQLGNTREATKEALDVIDNQVALLIDTVGEFTIENFQADMDTVQSIIDATAALLKGDMGELLTASTELNIPMAEIIGALKAGIDPASQFTAGINTIVDAFNDATKAQIAYHEALRIGEEIESNKPGFWSKLWGGMTEPIEGVGDLFSSFVRGWTKVGDDWKIESQKMIDEHNVYWKTKLPESQHSGLEEMRVMMEKYMGKSIIPDLMSDGFVHMEESTKNFTNNMKTYATTMDDLADTVADSARRATSAARSAERASSRARANADSSALGALI